MIEKWTFSNIFVNTAGHVHYEESLIKFDDLNMVIEN
jgi:hypothetical protein